MSKKTFLDIDVYDAAKARIREVYGQFDHVSVSFSGGKDSTVLLHLAIEVATDLGRLPVHAMFIDLEGQYDATIEHVRQMFDDPRVTGDWICVPLNLRNAASQFQPHWACWDPGEEANWVRPLPVHPSVVSDPSVYPFHRYRMEFEEFVPKYEEWLAERLGGSLGVLIGIRSDESLNRYKAVAHPDKKCAWNGVRWSSTKGKRAKAISFFPIYDWHVTDIWRYIGTSGVAYNRLYDWMYLHGTPLHNMRICQPYGDDQRVGLDQYQTIEPETWARILSRVHGVNYAARYARQKLLGYNRGVGLPAEFTDKRRPWKAYTKWLLSTIPPDVADQYRRNFMTYMLWWKANRRARGYPGIFDKGVKVMDLPAHMAEGKRRTKSIPSWQRMALCILKNDYWCHSLKFGQTVRIYERQQDLKEKYKDL